MDLLNLGFLALELQDLKVSDANLVSTSKRRISKNEKLGDNWNNNSDNNRKKIDNNDSINNTDKRKILSIISLGELALHDSITDCWIAINDYVYDCTEFIKSHPGGVDIIGEYAGRDATIAFIGTGHSRMAFEILNNYLIGELPTQERLFRRDGGIKMLINL
ncbi:cytochrome B5-like protein isoform X2 [Chelonus insularis]|nr:cytochrome B5-like protein isoform X2 [Chelonus insularis]